MGFDLKPGECSLHVIKSSSKNPQKGRGKRAPRGSFPTGPGAGFAAATSLWWSIPEIATLPEPDPARTSEDQSRIRAQHSRENFAWLNRRFPDSLPQANLFTPGTGTGETGFGPNVYFAGLRSSLEFSTCSGVMIWPV